MVYKTKVSAPRDDLKHRLSRIIGQLQGLQKRINLGESDCVADIAQIKAARNALWKFAEAYLAVHLDECMTQKKPAAEIRENLQTVIQSAFSV